MAPHKRCRSTSLFNKNLRTSLTETSISLQTSNDLGVTFTGTTILSGLEINSFEHKIFSNQTPHSEKAAGESWSDGLEFSARKLNSPGQHHDGRRLAGGGCFCVFFPQTSCCNLHLKHGSSSSAHPLQRSERGLSCLVRLVIMIIHRGSAVVIAEATCQVSQCCQVPTF